MNPHPEKAGDNGGKQSSDAKVHEKQEGSALVARRGTDAQGIVAMTRAGFRFGVPSFAAGAMVAACAGKTSGAELREAEAHACAGVGPDDRDTSPLAHKEDILEVRPLWVTEFDARTKLPPEGTVGEFVTFRAVQGLTAEWLQRVIDSHLARNAALGHVAPETPDCPQVPAGVEARVSSPGNGLAVAITSNNPNIAREILARAERLRAVPPQLRHDPMKGRLPVFIVAGFLLALCVPRRARADDPAAGKPLYVQNCMVCHGISGKGNGPSGKNLNPKPTDFTTAVPDDARWFKATKLGSKAIGKSNGMEGAGPKLTDQQIRDVLAYAKTLKKS